MEHKFTSQLMSTFIAFIYFFFFINFLICFITSFSLTPK